MAFPHHAPVVPLVIALAIGAAACGREEPNPTPIPSETETIAPVGGMTPSEIYARVSPSVAFIETPLATGTGVLVTPRHVLTNAHVVWPHDTVRVTFADGGEFIDAPVVGRDLLADLAVVDLAAVNDVPDGLEPASLADGTALPIGSDVYLIGYPGESEDFPQPAITRGILSRLRHWDAIDMPFLQTDADIAGGQSGGALVSDRGDVIGFSGLIFGESAFGLAMSAPEAMARAERLLAGDDVDGVAERPVPSSGGRNDHSVSLDNYWDEAAYVLEAPYGTLAELAVESGEDAVLAVISPYGDLEVEADETSGGIENGSFVTRDAGPYFVVANLDRAGDLTLESSQPIVPIVDPDDGVDLQVGRPRVALMDYPGDFDHFRLVLAKGQPVVVSVDTLSFSPELIIDSPGDGGTPPGVDTSVGGALGLTATASFIADVSGTYYIVVNDVEGVGTGGYLLTVE